MGNGSLVVTGLSSVPVTRISMIWLLAPPRMSFNSGTPSRWRPSRARKVSSTVRVGTHFAAAVQADGVAREIDRVEIDVRAFDREVDVAFAEGGAVGLADAEDFQQRDHHRQLVDVGVVQLDAATAAQRTHVLARTPEIDRRPQLAADVARWRPNISRAQRRMSHWERLACTSQLGGVVGEVRTMRPWPKIVPSNTSAVISRRSGLAVESWELDVLNPEP